MLKKLTGYLLALIGFIGFGFFKTYNGTVIPYPTLWFFLSIAIGITGLCLVYFTKLTRVSKQEKYEKQQLVRLRQSGEKILLTGGNCSIRENNYYQEIVNESSWKARQIDALYDPNRNYREDHVEQSAIIYLYKTGDKEYKMTSQTFPFNAATLTNYIEKNMLVLYVNPIDKTDYAFDITGEPAP